MTSLPDPNTLLEQRLDYRVRAYIAGGRTVDPEFTLPGLRSWMLSQIWPLPAPSDWLECVAVLCWSAICSIESESEREVAVRNELRGQMDYLDGASPRRPRSLDAFRSEETRSELYASLRNAAAPGSARRESSGLPRFNAADKGTR